jgi:octaprenyl-diphosphate synthase
VTRFASVKKQAFAAASARRVFDLISDELGLVEAEFGRQASSNIQVINYLGEYLRRSGGKRVRPALLILSAYAAGGKGRDPNVIRMATVMEMLHTATLVHDDIIDNADTRRNQPSVNAKFGSQTAVLMGDWLYMSAFETSLQERSLEILDILTRLTRKMTEGELIQTTLLGRMDITEDQYFDVLQRKTAYLFSACCQIGGILGGADEAVQKALGNYGLQLGIAFQLLDDLLDTTSESETLGKQAGSDLLEGKLTLPLIRLLKAEPELQPTFAAAAQSGSYTALSRREIQEKLSQYGILDDIRALATAHTDDARKSLEILLNSEYRLRLADVLSFVINRES